MYWDAERAEWKGDAESSLAELAPRWRDAGAAIIGGCCRTGPAQIAELAAALA